MFFLFVLTCLTNLPGKRLMACGILRRFISQTEQKKIQPRDSFQLSVISYQLSAVRSQESGVWIAVWIHKIIGHGAAGGNPPRPNLPSSRAVKGKFLNVSSNSKHSRHLPIGVARKNLPLTAHRGGRSYNSVFEQCVQLYRLKADCLCPCECWLREYNFPDKTIQILTVVVF